MISHIETKHTSTKKGRGVFALKNFKKGEIIEICPVIILSEREYKLCEKTILDDYMYEWRGKISAIILGNGLIYNHSYSPNATYDRDFKKKVMTYKALQPIKKGEEIVINYNGSPKDTSKINWFEMI